MKRIYTRKLGVFLAALLLATGVIAVFTPARVTAAPDEGGRVPYQYSVEDLNGQGIGGTMIGVIRDMHLPLGQSLSAQGWLVTDEGVAAYQYLWMPAGGGNADWQAVAKAEIFARGDLAAAGIPYNAGHGTAGFNLTIDPPEGIAEGVYDVYIRAIDGMGTPCDLVALLNLRYGEPDVDDGKNRIISFPRILREGTSSAVGDAAVTGDGVTLSGEGRVKLGEFNLAAFERLRITYTANRADTDIGDGRRPILGLKSSGDHGYGKAGESYNVTDNLAYAALDSATGEGTLEIDLTACAHYGDVWLTGYLGGEVTVTEIKLIYTGYVTDRVAAKINLSGDLIGAYFSGYNFTTATGVADPVLGDVLRLEVKEETNDPFVHFNAGKLLAENEIVLDADEYKYMVLLCRAVPQNTHGAMTFYLCAGPITGATEACTHSFNIQKDGQWHYYLIDLTQTPNWSGIINGWRFDYLNGNCAPGNTVEFASVQFFRTLEGAKKAAAQDPQKQTPFHSGDSAVIHDMSEESEGTKEDYVINPQDAYVVTEPETEFPTESTTKAPETPTEEGVVDRTESPAETDAAVRGCRCTLICSMTAILMAAAVLLIRKKD